jgi:protein TonB
MKFLLVIVLFAVSECTFSQTKKEPPAPGVKAGYGVPVEQTQPSYPGGIDSLHAFLKRTVHYPRQSVNEGARGKVWLNFTVDKEGNIRDSSVLKSVNAELDAEALHVLQEMPRWNPATAGGNPVDASYILQIEFVPPGQRP